MVQSMKAVIGQIPGSEVIMLQQVFAFHFITEMCQTIISFYISTLWREDQTNKKKKQNNLNQAFQSGKKNYITRDQTK